MRSQENICDSPALDRNDTIDLSFDMTTHLLKANPAVTEDRGRVAFQRGPIVFCMEHLDQPNIPRI